MCLEIYNDEEELSKKIIGELVKSNIADPDSYKKN